MDKIGKYLSDDHERLDELLNMSVSDTARIDEKAFSQFRQGLLRHIGIEEKIILPAIAASRDGEQLEVAKRLRLDHGALVALLVPPPSREIIQTIRLILASHNPLEEGENGVYHVVDTLEGVEKEEILTRVRNAPGVPSLPPNNRPGILEVTRRAVERAGYKPAF